MKSFGKGEVLAVLLLMGIAGTAAFFLWRGYREGPRGTGEAVGRIERVSRTTERKMARSARWFRADEASSVYNRDTLRTGPRSALSVVLDDGTRLEIGADSLLVVDRSDGTDLALASGTVRVSSKGGAGAVRLRTREGQAVLTGGSLLIDQKEGRSRIVLEEGTARFEPGPAPAASAITAPVVAAPAAERSPVPGEEDSGAGGEDIPDASPASPVLLEAGKLFDSESGEQRDVLPEDEELFAPVAVPDPVLPPRPLSPVNQRLARPAFTATVSLEWTRIEEAERYHVRLLDADTGSVIRERLVSQPSALLEVPAAGDYSWHVAVYSGIGDEPPASIEAGQTQYSERAGFSLETLRATAPALTLVTTAPASLLEGIPLLRWDRPYGVQSWELELFETDGSGEPLASYTLASPSFTANAAMVGRDWRARVRSRMPDGSLSDPAEIAFSIADWTALLTRTPADASIVRETPTFSWDDPNGGSRYRFELAGDPSFTDLLYSATVAARSFPLSLDMVDRARSLYWRVVLLDREGRALSESNVSTLMKPAALAITRLVEPASGAAFDPVVIPSLTFSWEAVPEATRYELRVYKRVGSEDRLVRELFVEEPFCVIDDFTGFSFDRFQWEVSAVEVFGEREQARSTSLRSWFRFEQSETIAVPKITVMKKKGVY